MAADQDSAKALKKTQESIMVILQNIDKDLAVQVVLAAVNLNYQYLVERATACSDVMYLREMLASLHREENLGPEDKPGTPDAGEIRAHLKLFGYKFQ